MACLESESPKKPSTVDVTTRESVVRTVESEDTGVSRVQVADDLSPKTSSDQQLGDPEASVSSQEYHFRSWLRGGKSVLNIVVVGQVGSGKSALINAIIGENVADEGEVPTKVTNAVIPHKTSKGGIDVTIFDTPGLLDPSEDDTKTFVDLTNEIDEIDLIVFCKKMTSRVDKGHIKLITNLVKLFGESVWKYTVVVLTFANEVKLPGRRVAEATAESLEEHFSQIHQEMEKVFKDIMKQKANVSSSIADAVLFVPAGCADSPAIPGCPDWLLQLWQGVFKTLKDNAKPAWVRGTQFPGTHEEVFSETDSDCGFVLVEPVHPPPIQNWSDLYYYYVLNWFTKWFY